jgi:hypothetical protein
MKKKAGFAVMLASFLLVAGCSSDGEGSSGDGTAKYGVLYSNCVKADTRFVSVSDSGENLGEKKASLKCATYMEPDQDNGHILISEGSNQIGRLSSNYDLKTEEMEGLVTFYKKDKDLTLVAYNREKDNVLHITQNGKSKQIKHEGFISAATYDENYIYLFVDVSQDVDVPKIQVIDRKKLDNFKEIELKSEQGEVRQMVLIGDKVVMTSGGENYKKLTVLDRKSWKVDSIDLSFGEAEGIVQDGNHYIVYNHEGNLAKLDSSAKVVEQAKLSVEDVLRIQVDGDRLYVLTSLDEGDPNRAGEIRVFDKNGWKEVSKSTVPSLGKEILPQDFILLKSK